jgi:hypothetical protein
VGVEILASRDERHQRGAGLRAGIPKPGDPSVAMRSAPLVQETASLLAGVAEAARGSSG